MLCQADSVGVFQVESRAQMSMLPRLKPRNYYDLVVEVAIVRPGPIQGGMVHPYLKNRAIPRQDRLSQRARSILKRTRGVPLFQEQAMQIAIDCAASCRPRPTSCAAPWRPSARRHHPQAQGRLHQRHGRQRLRARVRRALLQADRGLRRIRLPESHAASFAILVYVSSWVKYYYPEVFAAALLNSQPMGFYAPAQLVRDAREHGVEVRPPDVNASDWDCTLEPSRRARCALRLGLRQVTGLQRDDIKRMVERRTTPYRDPADLWRRGGLSKRQILALARADAFASMGLTRRDVLWAVRGFSEARCRCSTRGRCATRAAVSLPRLTLGEQVVDDYARSRCRCAPIRCSSCGRRCRSGAWPTRRLREAADGDFLQMAGWCWCASGRAPPRRGVRHPGGRVRHRQPRGLAEGLRSHRRIVMGARLLGVAGKVQRDVQQTERTDRDPSRAERLWDWSADLDRIAATSTAASSCAWAAATRPIPRRPIHATSPSRGPKEAGQKQPYDRSRIILDRPSIKIASRDFH
jgi:error-prone DNA polymerase